MLLPTPPHPPVVFDVDFGRWSGPPLVRGKFGVYATPFTPVDELAAKMPLLREIGVRDFRYEIAWGKPDAVAFDAVGGTAQNPTTDFAPLDRMLDALEVQGVKPLLALGYCPNPLKTSVPPEAVPWGAWKDQPKNLDSWRRIVAAYAGHWAERETKPFYEVWNEPDMPEATGKMFYSGAPDDYARLYDATHRGVSGADPEAEIGGPAIAYDRRYLEPLLSRPMAFASIHGYANFAPQLDGMRAALKSRPEVPIFLTEYASFNAYPLLGPSTRAEAAARFLRDVPGLLSYGDVPKVYWAQWIDDVLGLVGRDGKRRALFNAFTMYAMMPVDRVAVAPDGASEGITAFASSDGGAAAVALANTSGEDREVTVAFRRPPKDAREILAYRIDPKHASFVDDPATERLEINERTAMRGFWRGTLPRNGSVLLRLVGGKTPVATPMNARHLSARYVYPDRLSGADANFDPVTMTARLGLEGKPDASATVGAVLGDPPKRFRVRATRIGPKADLSLRIAFSGTSGIVLLNDLPSTTSRTVDLARLAPRRWDGRRIEATFTLSHAAATGARAKLQLLR